MCYRRTHASASLSTATSPTPPPERKRVLLCLADLFQAGAGEALRMANGTLYGLAAAVWSRDIDTVFRIARGVRAGTVAANGYSEGDITTPFGGSDNGPEALEQYTELKTRWVRLRNQGD